ncbi:MAG: hypothetical protein LBC63_03735 [Holophagales bacterium]|jgi:hypothetical protein|nr:hypothetical protein [Holophagales bacterium]
MKELTASVVSGILALDTFLIRKVGLCFGYATHSPLFRPMAEGRSCPGVVGDLAWSLKKAMPLLDLAW